MGAQKPPEAPKPKPQPQPQPVEKAPEPEKPDSDAETAEVRGRASGRGSTIFSEEEKSEKPELQKKSLFGT